MQGARRPRSANDLRAPRRGPARVVRVTRCEHRAALHDSPPEKGHLPSKASADHSI